MTRKPLTKEAFAFMIEGVAAQLATRKLMMWWSCMDNRYKARFRKDARERLLNREIAGVPDWQDVTEL